MDKHEKTLMKLEIFQAKTRLRTDSALSKKMGVNRLTLTQFRNGYRDLPPKWRLKFIEVFGREPYVEIFGQPQKTDHQKLWEAVYHGDSEAESSSENNKAGSEGSDQ